MTIAQGTYPARARSYRFGYTKGDKEQLVVEFEILGDSEEAGRTIPWFGYFTEKTWARTLESLRYCGWQGDDLSHMGELDQEVEIVVEHEHDDDGNVIAKVRWVNHSGGRVTLRKPMNQDALRLFAASMKNRAKETRANGARGNSRNAPPDRFNDAPSLTDDDIPF